MKTQFTVSVEEAEQRLAVSMFDDVPYVDNIVSVKIVLPVEQTDNLPLNRASKIALIKFARTLAEDYRNGRLTMTNRDTNGPRIGEPYFGLGDAKDYVENYLKANTPLTLNEAIARQSGKV